MARDDGTAGQPRTGHLSADEPNPGYRGGPDDLTEGQKTLGHHVYEEPNPRTDGTGGTSQDVPEVRRMGYTDQSVGASPVTALNYVERGGDERLGGGACIVNWRGGSPINAPPKR